MTVPGTVLSQPESATTADANRIKAGGRTSHLICDRLPSEGQLEILQGLYLGEVGVCGEIHGEIRGETPLHIEPDGEAVRLAVFGTHREWVSIRLA